MMNQIRKAMSSEKGFTLVELLVVIGIIGILAMMLLPQFRGMRDRARVASCQSNLKNIGTTLESYYADKESYPLAQADFAIIVTGKIAYCPHAGTPAGLYTYLGNPTRAGAAGALQTFADTSPVAGTRIDSYSVECPFHAGLKAGNANFPENVQMFVTQNGVERVDIP